VGFFDKIDNSMIVNFFKQFSNTVATERIHNCKLPVSLVRFCFSLYDILNGNISGLLLQSEACMGYRIQGAKWLIQDHLKGDN